MAKPEPPWGEASNGFVVALTLDKDAYAAGADINFHFSCSRLTADWKQSGAASSIRPCRPAVELKDVSGAPVQLDVSGDFALCEWRDKGGGPSTTLNIEQGAVLTYELNLTKDCVGAGGFPGKPGTYTATAVWDARSSDPDETVTVRSRPITFSIAGK